MKKEFFYKEIIGSEIYKNELFPMILLYNADTEFLPRLHLYSKYHSKISQKELFSTPLKELKERFDTRFNEKSEGNEEEEKQTLYKYSSFSKI